MRGVLHRQVQRCHNGHLYAWAPSRWACPYCSLTQAERQISMQDKAEPEPCPTDCCP
jgi:ribosomal protein S27AE